MEGGGGVLTRSSLVVLYTYPDSSVTIPLVNFVLKEF